MSAAAASSRQRRIELVYFDAGGGHRAAAAALAQVATAQYRRWHVETVNLRDVLDPADFIRRACGLKAETIYNAMLKANLTSAVGPLLKVMHLLIRASHSRMVPLVARHYLARRPDLLVSLIPHFNRVLFEGLRVADAATGSDAPTPMVTIMTDLADYPPHFWIERQDQFVICGTAAATRQALGAGLAPERILRVSGMIVSPKYYQTAELDRGGERGKLGLDPELPTGFVMFGGYGSRRMEVIAKRVAGSGLRCQLIFICGHNQRLRQRLTAMKLPFPKAVIGFTAEVPHLMRLADFFIGKPGPGSISEALAAGLPVIVERNGWTMVHERYNTDWIYQNRFGVVLRSFAEIENGIAAMLDPRRAVVFRARIGELRNRAVFEIPDLLDAVMASRQEFGEMRAPALEVRLPIEQKS